MLLESGLGRRDVDKGEKVGSEVILFVANETIPPLGRPHERHVLAAQYRMVCRPGGVRLGKIARNGS